MSHIKSNTFGVRKTCVEHLIYIRADRKERRKARIDKLLKSKWWFYLNTVEKAEHYVDNASSEWGDYSHYHSFEQNLCVDLINACDLAVHDVIYLSIEHCSSLKGMKALTKEFKENNEFKEKGHDVV